VTAAGGGEGTLELAARRLERAVGMLEQRISAKLAEANAGAGEPFDTDRSRLAAQLDEARSRERALEEAGAAASAALDRAITEIRTALGAPATT